jgi:hypothetical protein
MVNTNSKRSKKTIKTNKELLGYCDDPNNKEIQARMSDEENEFVYDFFPLMTRPLQVPLGKYFYFFYLIQKKLSFRKKRK